MRFLLDEGLPYRLAVYLQARGYDVTAVGHDYPFALADREILAIATGEKRIVLTTTRISATLVFRDRCGTRGHPLSMATFRSIPGACWSA